MFVQLAVLACALAAASAAWNGPLAGGLPASSVPAGISPQACPNYPHCSNPLVAIEPNAPAQQGQYGAPQYNSAPAPQYNPAPTPQYNSAPAPQYNPAPAPQYNPAPAPQYQYNAAPQYNSNALDSGAYTGDGDYRGEGLAESGAFGPVDNPQSYNNAPAYQPAPAYQSAPAYQPAPAYNGAPAQSAPVPAGVDPHSCPNYPYCQ